jgi:hypothetical protein
MSSQLVTLIVGVGLILGSTLWAARHHINWARLGVILFDMFLWAVLIFVVIMASRLLTDGQNVDR